MSDNKKPPRDWESAIDKQIRAAMERGEFDNLRGAGKPLNLGEYSHVPDDWQLAFKILKDAGYAPEWIEQGKEIRAELQSLATFLEQQARRQRERRAHLASLVPDRQIAEREHLAHARERACRVYRERAAALNKAIDVFNLSAEREFAITARANRRRISAAIKKPVFSSSRKTGFYLPPHNPLQHRALVFPQRAQRD